MVIREFLEGPDRLVIVGIDARVRVIAPPVPSSSVQKRVGGDSNEIQRLGSAGPREGVGSQAPRGGDADELAGGGEAGGEGHVSLPGLRHARIEKSTLAVERVGTGDGGAESPRLDRGGSGGQASDLVPARTETPRASG